LKGPGKRKKQLGGFRDKANSPVHHAKEAIKKRKNNKGGQRGGKGGGTGKGKRKRSEKNWDENTFLDSYTEMGKKVSQKWGLRSRNLKEGVEGSHLGRRQGKQESNFWTKSRNGRRGKSYWKTQKTHVGTEPKGKKGTNDEEEP